MDKFAVADNFCRLWPIGGIASAINFRVPVDLSVIKGGHS